MLPAMRTLFVALLSLSWILSGCDTRAQDKEDMIVLMQTLDSCNNASDGNNILGIFTQSTWAHNDRLIKLGLEGTEAEVKALPLFDRMEVLRMRLRSNREELSKLKGMEYTRFATSRGWYVTPVEQRAESTLDRFKFSAAGDEAWAYLVVDGEPTQTKIHFIKEGGEWRYDEPEAMIAYGRDYAREARQEGMSENEYIILVLEEEIGREVPDSVWQPLAATPQGNDLFAPPPK